MSKEIKPCPFCGGEARDYQSPQRNGEPLYFVACIECLAASCCYPTREEALMMWNKRDDLLVKLRRLLGQVLGGLSI